MRYEKHDVRLKWGLLQTDIAKQITSYLPASLLTFTEI